MTRRAVAIVSGMLWVLSTACAPRGVALPGGDGEAFAGYEQAFQEATSGCRSIRTLSAELAISGRAGDQKVRGRVVSGFERPGRLRLEGVAPFGPPLFILVDDGTRATLLLPRDNRVLTGSAARAILDALVGLDLGAADLLAILTGCVVADPTAVGGRIFAGGWARIDLKGGGAVYLRQDSARRWRVRAGLRPPMRIDYDGGASLTPGSVRLRTSVAAETVTDLQITVSQAEVNAPLGPDVFTVKVPADATPLSLAELRRTGPLGR